MTRTVYAVHYPEAGGLVFRGILGSGRDGTASLVHHVRTGELLVRKVISKNMSTHETRAHPEVRYQRPHSNIPRLIDSNTDDSIESTIIVSSYCNGGSVSQFRSFGQSQRNLLFPEILIWRMLSHVLAAVTECHRSEPSVFHRDIHSANIFLHWPSEQPSLPSFYLGDFGRARDAQSFGAPSHVYKSQPQAHMSALFGSRMADDIFNLAAAARALMTEPNNHTIANKYAAKMGPNSYYSPALHAVLSAMVIKSPRVYLDAAPLRFYTWNSYNKTVTNLQQEIDQKLALLEAQHVPAAWQIVPEAQSPLWFASASELLSNFKAKEQYPPGSFRVAKFRISDEGSSELLEIGMTSYTDIDGRLCEQRPDGDSWEWKEVELLEVR